MMRAVWLILAAGFRRQWKSWLLLTVLIAVASGFVLASTAAGRRTDSAFPRYVASHGYDAIVYTVQPLPQLGQLPEVAQVTPVQMPFIGLPGCVAYDLYPGPGFAVATKGTPALTSYYVRLRHGQADFARFEARTSRVDGAGVQDLDRPAATITSSIHPQAVGWLVLAALAGLAAVAVVGPALARQASAESADHPVLATLGLSPRQLAARVMLRTLVVAVAGAAGGIAVATLLSPLAPLGEARLAEPAPGLSFDAGVLGLGALATVAVVLALGVLPALRAARMRGAADRAPVGRTSAVAGAAAAAGAPPGAVIGIRRALERGRGSRAVPVGTALIGSVAGVAALCVTAVFGSSLAHLTATPALYGAPFQDIFIGGGPGDLGQDPVITELKGDRAIGQITLVSVPAITVNRIGVRAVAATAVRGPMLLSAAEGRLPADDGQIALGASTMRMVGARIGSLVRVTATAPGGGVHAPPTVPAALVNFGASAAFPLLLGGVVAVCGLAALAHLLVVSVARRRTEGGLLMALGMVRRQLAAIVFWQATTVAVIAIAAGIPLGIAAGRAIWRAFAISLGVVPVPVVQTWLIVALAAGALLAANALAAVPAMTAARSRPGQLLRTE